MDKGKGKLEPVFELVRRPATERVFPPLPDLNKDVVREDEEMTSNFTGSDPSLDIICNVVSILPVEYDIPSEVSEVESDFTEEMAIHRPLCYYVMNNGCVEDQHAVFEKPDASLRMHLKPLFVQARINGVGVNKVLVDGGATVNLLPQSFLGKIGLFDSDLKPHNVIVMNYEGTPANSMGAVEVDMVVGSVSITTMFMVVPSKANFNVLLGREWIHGVGAVPSTLHQRVAIWKEDGLVENIEADQRYFLAEVNNITKKNFDKQLATISPVMSPGPKHATSNDEMFSMKLQPEYGFVWERGFIGDDYVVIDKPSEVNSVHKHDEAIDSLPPKSPGSAVSPIGWDIEK